jgi:hypothetical protein
MNVSDGGSWQPPEPPEPPGGAQPPPPPTGPAGGFAPPSFDPPTTEVVIEPLPSASSGGGRSRGKLVAAVVGAAAIVAAGVFAATRVSGDSGSGGASTPEAAANDFLDALDQEDVLGLVDVLLPGERDTFRQPMQDLVKELTRLEVLSDNADLSKIGGVDIAITDRHVEVEETNADDIVNVSITAKAAATVKGEELPIGKWIRDSIGEKDMSELDTTSDPEEDTFPVTVVRKDGRWYLSLFYSIAESARHGADDPDIPEKGVALKGADTPEAAMDTMIKAAADLDLATVIGALNPNEAEALQRYAPLFLDDAQAEADKADVKIDISDTKYEVTGSGDTRHVSISAFKAAVSTSDESASAELDDGCLIVKGTDDNGDEQTFDTCKDFATNFPDSTGVDADQLKDVQDTVKQVLSDYSNPGFTVKQVGGKWYLSPIATGFDQLLALSKALTRSEIEDVVDKFQEMVETAEDNGGEFELPNLDDYTRSGGWTTVPDSAPLETVPSDTEAVPSTVPEDSTSSTEADPATTCYGETEATTAAQCFANLVSSGQIEPSSVPWYFQHPECGAADAYWAGQYYSLPDAEFVQLINQVAPCFQALVTNGTMDEFAVPPEIQHPECLKGINPYRTDVGDEVFDDFLTCAIN